MSDFIVCRCEGVHLSEIPDSIEGGASAIPGVKKRIRVGMGACQGRVCQRVVSEIIAAKNRQTGKPIFQRAQAPVRPTLLKDL